jgi:sugar lactone lactonase YvrE
MQIHRLLGIPFAACASLAVLAACSTNGEQLSAPASPLARSQQLGAGAMKSARTAQLHAADRVTYVSEGPGGISTIVIYPTSRSNPPPKGQITKNLDNPVGMCVDTHGNLYVANIDGSAITVYSRRHKLIRTLSIGVQGPVSVAVGSDGMLYASEYDPQAVVEFAPGKQSPTRTLSVPGSPWGVALDASNNLYVSYEGSDSKGHVEKFPPKSQKGTDLGITVGRAVDLRIDKLGDIALGDGVGAVVNVYGPGQTTPLRQISTGTQNPYMLALDKPDKHLYVTTTTQVLIFDYQTGAQVGSITNGLSEATGVALYPPAPM